MTQTNLHVQYMRTAQLRANPENARLHGDKQIRQLADSIRTFGFNVPLLIKSNLTVIAGHCRLLAAELLGITEVPVICLDHLTGDQARAFAIADNRLTENAEWDKRLLGEQLRMLSEAELDFSLANYGF
jgi:ParB-like chromosome segregation protein Spo0J